MRVIDTIMDNLQVHITISERNVDVIQLNFMDPDPNIDRSMTYFLYEKLENNNLLTDDDIVKIVKNHSEFHDIYINAKTHFNIQ